MPVSLRLENRTGWDTGDLRRFFLKGLEAMGARGRRHIIVVPAPQRSRGCAEVGQTFARRLREGEAIVIAMASPANFSLRRLARLFEHEVSHTLGYEHHHMGERLYWSLGRIPYWAEGSRIRYRGRAPRQDP